MYLAIGVEPTKPTAWMTSESRIASTDSLSPWTTLNTPAGPPASMNSSARRTGTEGSRSEGLSTKALPAASAGPAFHSGIIAGKLNGVMPATTPSGWRMEYTSMPVPTELENSPLRKCGAPTENSRTSVPRAMSPLASSKVLPCSSDRVRASSSMLSLISEIHFMMMRMRFCGFVFAQPACACSALAMTSSTSAAEASSTRACSRPVEGFMTGAVRPPLPGRAAPSTKCVIVRVISAPELVVWGLRGSFHSKHSRESAQTLTETCVTLEKDCDRERRTPQRKRCCGPLPWGFVVKR